jgi:hypothetical protein
LRLYLVGGGDPADGPVLRDGGKSNEVTRRGHGGHLKRCH